jgi:ABC-2 type transport system ATP-binding protein
MKILTGYISPSSGSATIDGVDVVGHTVEVRRRIGYLPETTPLYYDLQVNEFLTFAARLRGLGGRRRRERLTWAAETCHLGAFWRKPIGLLSRGQKQRVGFAQAILHDPDVLILDEPTDGLDPNQKHEVRELIRSMSAQKLIVISTHILEEVEAVCNRAIIISDGRMLADDTPFNLAATSRYHNAVRLTLADDVSLDEVEAAIAALESVDQTEVDREHRAVTAIPHAGRPNIEPWQAVSDLVKMRNWRVSSLQLDA